MNETNSTNENPTEKKRSRRNYDAEFKKAAVEHCARHGGDVHRTAGELGVNYRTLRDWVEAARAKSTPPVPPRSWRRKSDGSRANWPGSPRSVNRAERDSPRAEPLPEGQHRRVLANPKKIVGHPLDSVTTRYRQLQQLATAHPVSVLCPLLGVSRSGCYGWRQRAASRRQSEDARLTEELENAFEQSRRTYGRPRLTRALRARGHCHGERRIGRLMRAAGLCARPRRRFVPKTTDSRHDAPNRLAERAAPPTQPDEVWSVDMTYIETTEGWLFLAIVLDLHSRKVVGWAFAESLHTTLPLAALHMALGQRRPARGLLHHSDRGCQYASAEYRSLLSTHGLEASMSRTAIPTTMPPSRASSRPSRPSASTATTQSVARKPKP